MSTILNTGYIWIDLKRNLRQYVGLFFAVFLPVFMFVIFGTMADFSSNELGSGRGNVTASIMVNMGAYAAITATTGLAGAAAAELQQGWGRQIGITPFPTAGFIASKVVVALAYSVLAVGAVYVTGLFVGTRMDAWVWPATFGLLLVGAVTFALYGLAFGLLFRSEAAVSAASGLVVVMMFLGNAFMPLSGILLKLSVFVPVWGITRLAAYPLDQGETFDAATGDVIQYELWQILLNVVAWSIVFAVLCVVGARRGTGRK